ncbi:hypothetical protein [Paenibacillus alkalitolerans]|uniref:hypothetical protein n=1 Tax=Paenibacillus alkalitolerans TaxID=2799335 RepID=UPI0018F5A2DD
MGKGVEWAPSVAKYNGKYYMYFTAEQQIGVVTRLRENECPLIVFSRIYCGNFFYKTKLIYTDRQIH